MDWLKVESAALSCPFSRKRTWALGERSRPTIILALRLGRLWDMGRFEGRGLEGALRRIARRSAERADGGRHIVM